MKSSARNILIAILLFAMVGTAGKGEEIPRSFFRTYGLMARAVWASYQKDGEFDIEGLASDSLKQEFGAFDAYTFATIAADINVDPFNLLTAYLSSGEVRKMTFALGAIMWLGDRRFDQKIAKLTSSKISMGRDQNRIQPPGPIDPFGSSDGLDNQFERCETIGDLATIVADMLASTGSDGLINSEAKWLIKARAIQTKAAP